MNYLTRFVIGITCMLFISNNSFSQLSFTDIGQTFGNGFVYDIAVGDIDGDGDLDAFVTADTLTFFVCRIWFNNGEGFFTPNGQTIVSTEMISSVGLADLDGDSDLDAFITYGSGNTGVPSEVWINDGKGNFTNSGQQLGHRQSVGVALADLDSDGDVDAFVCNHALNNQTLGGHQIWFNDGTGKFKNSGQDIGSSYHRNVHLGDIDDDGDLDALVTDRNSNNTVYVNNGNGVYTQKSILTKSYELKLGDIDNDKDLDIVTSDGKIWLNDGKGKFTISQHNLGSFQSNGIALADVDNDGDLDVLLAKEPTGEIWINDGTGLFSKSNQSPVNTGCITVKFADLNNDGNLDLLIGTKIYLNNSTSNNDAPSIPFGLVTESLSTKDVVLRWSSASDDHTPTKGLNYNVFVIRDRDTVYTRPPMADTITGLRNIADKGTSQDAFCILKSLRSGVYRWGVQAIDGAYKGGVFAKSSFTISVTGIKETKTVLPKELKLNQNYPNPFNPSTTINYHLSASNNVKLKIFDLLGREIKTLINSFQNAGEYSLMWDATDNGNNLVSSGIYFYLLKFGEINLQKKMLLVR